MNCSTQQAVLTHLVQQFGLESEQVEAMLPQFFVALKGYHEDLGAVIASGDLVEIATAAHKIKGSLLNLGLSQAGALACQLETSAKASAECDYVALYAELCAELDWLA